MVPAPGTPSDVFATLQTAIDTGHKQRVALIMEAAAAMALKLKLEGKMTNAAWAEMDAAISQIEKSGAVTIAALNQLGPAAQAAIPPAMITAGVQRLNALNEAMMAAVAQHTVANGNNPASVTGESAV